MYFVFTIAYTLRILEETILYLPTPVSEVRGIDTGIAIRDKQADGMKFIDHPISHWKDWDVPHDRDFGVGVDSLIRLAIVKLM